MKLSLSMIVKDEERFLPGCLESVADLVDEMVIVDTGSSDETKKIAKKFGARVFEFEWCDDFSAARNYSLKNTTGDWVLYLDADERLTKAYHPKIRKLIASGKADAFLLMLKSKIGAHEQAQYHLVSYPRLFRKKNGVTFTGRAHEQITTSLVSIGARIVQSDIIIDHLGYAQSDDVILEKAKRNHRLLLSQLETRENYGYVLYQLGQTEIILGDIDKGLARLREALAAGGFGKSVEASIHAVIAENIFKKGNPEAAIIECDKSIQSVPEQTFAYLMKGDILMKLGKYRESLSAYTRAIDNYKSTILVGKSATAVEPVFDVNILYSKLGSAASSAGQTEIAKTYLEMAARVSKNECSVAAFLEYLARNKMFGEVFEKANEFQEFRNADWYLRLISSVMIDTGDFAGAANLLEKIGSHDKVSLSSLANCRVKIGDLSGADSAFQRAVRMGYSNLRDLELFGLVQFKLGKYGDSMETLTRVVSAEPTNLRASRFLHAAQEMNLSANSSTHQ